MLKGLGIAEKFFDFLYGEDFRNLLLLAVIDRDASDRSIVVGCNKSLSD